MIQALANWFVSSSADSVPLPKIGCDSGDAVQKDVVAGRRTWTPRKVGVRQCDLDLWLFWTAAATAIATVLTVTGSTGAAVPKLREGGLLKKTEWNTRRRLALA
ncbi:hypothetical protein OPQ81_002002 [Rhizoctonia solani]|nr:hypothetical protein OPQ81_002002 [Rhizoctonia solani]